MPVSQKSSSRLAGRRQFLRQSAALAGVVGLPALIPSSALGMAGTVSPSNRVTLGCVGLGTQGMGDMGAFRGNPEVRVLAVCDVLKGQRENAKKSVDEFYDNKDCAVYTDFRELMGRKDIDAVQITAPDHWHALMALEATRQKKHMYCEKPMGWSLSAAQAVRKAVKDSGVIFEFGTQQRSIGKMRFACELVRNGKIGKLKTILVGVPGMPGIQPCPIQPTEEVPKELDYDLWLGPAPMKPYSYERCRPFVEGKGYSVWYTISDYCMGMIGNWGVHHLDIAQWGNDTELSGPTEVEGKADFFQGMLSDCAYRWQIENRYANGVTLVHMDDATAEKHPLQAPGHAHGVMFIGTEGWVHVARESIDANPKSLLKLKLADNELHLLKSNNHQANLIDAIKGRTQVAAPIDVAVRSDTMCILQLAAVKLKRKLTWDPVAEAFVNDDEANKWLERPMRAPWKV